MTSGDLSLCPDMSQEELDFSDLFLYHSPAEGFPVDRDKADSGALSDDNQPPVLVVDHHGAFVSSPNQTASGQDLSSHRPTTEHPSGPVSDSLDQSSRPRTIPAPSPRIEITLWYNSLSSQTPELSPTTKTPATWRECVSPASSNSSTGFPTETCSPAASPCVSPSNEGFVVGLSGLDLCPGLQGIHTSSAHSSPGASPRCNVTEETFLVPQHQHATSSTHHRSRSASPHGKRSYDQTHSCQGVTPVKQRSRSTSPIPSPHEQQGSYYLHQFQALAEIQCQDQTSTPGMEEMLSSLSSRLPKVVPSTMVPDVHEQAKSQYRVYGEEYDSAIEQERMSRPGAEVTSETFSMLQAVWPPPYPVNHGAFCALPASPPPSLEWPFPSHSGQYELLIKEQPRSHHRAHYETEGSRGAVKTSSGGHPEVQLRGYQGTAPLGLQVFIGTADERLLKPHAFYQVHRITGKTVATPSMERMIYGTKVLEMPLEPKNLMRVVIDCVGILKLRNADIELWSGETDIGRKNTRVRLVFRVHIPQRGGQLTSLQVASDPIECSQRSAQEVPVVERQDLDRCSVLGGQPLVLTGQNFTCDTKVIFSEKTQDGQQVWEVEATLDKDKTQANMLFVEVPPYRDRNICHPAKVNFYVINGKKKRSQPQHFIYTPAIEPLDDDQLNLYGYSVNQSMMSLYRHLEDSNLQTLSISPTLSHSTTLDPRAHFSTPVPLDDQPVYQSRTGALTNSSMFYHTALQHNSNCGTDLLCGSPLASHPASTPSQRDSARAPVAKVFESPHVGDSVEACMMSRHQRVWQKTLPVGKSPPSRCNPGQAQGKAGSQLEPSGQCPTQIGSGGGNHEEGAPARITDKQKNLHYSYLEDGIMNMQISPALRVPDRDRRLQEMESLACSPPLGESGGATGNDPSAGLPTETLLPPQQDVVTSTLNDIIRRDLKGQSGE